MDAIKLLNGDSTVEGSVKNTVTTEVAKVVADAPEDFDTLKEIADYIAADKTNAANIESTLSSHTSTLTTLNGQFNQLTQKLTTKADASQIPTVPTSVSAFTNDAGYLTSVALDGLTVKKITQDEYDALETKDSNVLYIIIG